MEHYLPSSHETPSEVYLGLKRPSLNDPNRLNNSSNVPVVSNSNANVNRLFQYPQQSLGIPSLYHNPNLFNNSNINSLSHLNLSNKNVNLPIDRQDFHFQTAVDTRDNQITSNLNVGQNQFNHRRRPSLLQSSSFGNDFNFNSQHISYFNSLNERYRDNLLSNNLLSTNKNVLSQHYSMNPLSVASALSNNGSLNLSANQTPTTTVSQNFKSHQPHLNLTQSNPSLNYLQSQSPYLDNNASFNKRPRLGIQPLLIDTNVVEVKKEPAYTVLVEAISPTPNEDTRPESCPIKTTKDDILQHINQIDREITQTENQMSKLKKRQQQLEALTKNASGKSSDNNDYLESKQQSITQVIYNENRKKASDSELILDKLSSKIMLPLYNQPSDTKVYHDNIEKFAVFKISLIKHFKNKIVRKQRREKFLTENYDNLMQEWLKKLENKDTNPMKKTKDNKLREFFEKQFPELKKQREDKERLSRAGQRVRSDADLEDIMDGIQEQELEDKKIRAYSVIPPILHDEKERAYKFKTMNCKVEDPVSEHKELQLLNIWTDSEKEIFKEKFLQAPKNFGLIASYLDRKSVMDCVQYYYSSKKRENYKQLLRKNAKKRTRALAKAQQQAAQQAAQQVAQQQEQHQQLQRTIALQARNAKQLELEKENLTKPSNENKSLEKSFSIEDKAKKNQDDEDLNCLKCLHCTKKINSNSKSYIINRNNCFLYGFSIEDIKQNSRLCHECKINFGTGECPVPSCRNPKKLKRRLKTLPREWFELTPELRYTFSAELNFPLDCKRCCTQCYIRLLRKYSACFKNLSMKKYLNCNWDENEIEKLKNAIRKNGRNWDIISTFVGTKTTKQCRQFYFYFKYNLKLDELMKMTTFQTDDFDSDNCWNEINSDNESSEDEYLIERRIDCDKILDPNIERLQDCKKLCSSQLSLKSDCDSSATMSADEGQSNLDQELRMNSPLVNQTRTNSTLTSHLTSVYDKLRPTAIDSVDIDGKLKAGSQINQRYLDNLIAQQKQRIPSFLINPNAPTVPSTNQSKTLMRQNSPITSIPQLQPSQIVQQQNFSPQLPQQTPQQGKDKPTCVRDLIYQTIDITFQADKNLKVEQPQQLQQQTKEKQLNVDQINRQNLPLYYGQEIKRETVLSDNKNKFYPVDSTTINSKLPKNFQQMIPPYNLSLAPNIPIVSNQPSAELENEVQDLSKKTIKKEINEDFSQPKNYSIPKSSKDSQKTNFNEYNSLNSFNISMPPPPAHSNPLSRTSTPGLDNTILVNSNDQLQNFYMSNRHTESPRNSKNIYPTERVTPNHLTASPTSSSRSLSRGSSTSKINIPPPPLIANNLINSSNLSSFSNKLNNFTNKNLHQGSITQGTPVLLGQSTQDSIQQQILMSKEAATYENLLLANSSLNLQQPSSSRESSGSITLGTPLYRRNMPQLNFLSNQNSFNLPTTIQNFNANVNSAIMSPNSSKANFGNESQLSTQNQIMIDFNTSKQMQKRGNISESKERNSPLQLNRLNQFTSNYPGLPLGFNPALSMNQYFDIQKPEFKIDNLKSSSPSTIESSILSSKNSSPKISSSPSLNARQNIIHSTTNLQSNIIKNSQSVIQTSQSKNSNAHILPLYSQAHDAFQTLVNTAVAQQSLIVLNKNSMNQELDKKISENFKSQDEHSFKNESLNLQAKEDEKNLFNFSALKFARNPFTKEQFEKELKSQELMKKQKTNLDEAVASLVKNDPNLKLRSKLSNKI